MKESKFKALFEETKASLTPVVEEEVVVTEEAELEDLTLTEASDEEYLQYVLKLGEHLEGKLEALLPKYVAKLDKNKVPAAIQEKFYTFIKSALGDILPSTQSVFESKKSELSESVNIDSYAADYNRTDLRNFIRDQFKDADIKPVDIYFDDVDLVYIDKTVLGNAFHPDKDYKVSDLVDAMKVAIKR